LSFQDKERKKIGIFGGTFDPVHTVHLIVAEQAREALGLDEVWFMPAHIPPHKLEKHITADCHRLAMLERAIQGNENFCATAIELDRKDDKPSYTYDTILSLKAKHPNVDFYFIIGGDMVEYLPKWHRIEELVSLVQFVALARPGYSMQNEYTDRVIEVEMPQLDVSSTIIRHKAFSGESIRYLVPESVRLYIEENGLYES
jgi:nicotinate-nucleotide adenylyltransferase